MQVGKMPVGAVQIKEQNTRQMHKGEPTRISGQQNVSAAIFS